MELPNMDDKSYYQSLGLRCGLEIHQQLDTKKKLFCNCPAKMKKGEPTASILRHMRPTLSELGEYDGTALMEFKTKKEIVYQLFPDVMCTYEMDDTPPFSINQEAVDISLEIALLLKCNIVNELHVSRKQYLDGSIPTGFQRTAIVGVEGWIPYKDGKIGIIQLGLEEDACREIKEEGHTIYFRTDRLSIPLVEVVTSPDITTPQEAKEVARLLGRLMRTTGKVRRGIGSVRQDVNVSIKGGTRVEIKGVSRHQYIPRLVACEVLRQQSLLKIRDILKSRGITPMTLRERESPLTKYFRRTEVKVIKDSIRRKGMVAGVKLDGFGGILDTEIGPGRTFAQDISSMVKVIACLDSVPNMAHISKFEELGMSKKEIRSVIKHFGAKHTDDIIIVWGPQEDVELAIKEIIIRATEATQGVPNETRQALDDGTTDFERILPGPDRMYPDTDTPPMVITEERLDGIGALMPEPVWERMDRLKGLGLSTHLASNLSISPRLPIFDRIIKDLGVNPVLVAVTITQTMKAIRREGAEAGSISDGELYGIFDLYIQGRFGKEALADLLRDMAKGKSAKEALQDSNITPLSKKDIGALVSKVISKLGGKVKPRDFNILMGLVMKEARGSIDGEVVAKIAKAKAEL